MNNSHPILALTLARIRLFYREPGAMFWTFGFPILISLALGIAFSDRPPEPARVAVTTSAPAIEAERLFEALRGAAGLQVSLLAPAAAAAELRAGRIDLVVVQGSPLTYRFDAARPEARLARALVDAEVQRAAGRRDPLLTTDALVTEPGARYIDFLVPGLIGINVMSSGMWGIGYVIVETRSQKLLKRMRSTPMRRAHFLLSFVLMRLGFAVLELPVLLLFARYVFGVMVQGSWLLLIGVTLLGALTFAGLGILVASRARNTSTVTGLINLVIMPMFILSGVFFSSSNFPAFMQPIIKILPLTALNESLRAIVNEGAGLMVIAPRLFVLVAIAVVAFFLGLKIFRWS